ncbi:hypothetical protein ElyMa_004439800 [Elysia marginata]|uniref:Tudor domain-containing protein n=1 Tax=Elysia marginata TaxID=1093978 RepID=A0AAV4HFL4_9GAST|nr:hypothetical protein ElyMa_004439800 [Elysia marginata]
MDVTCERIHLNVELRKAYLSFQIDYSDQDSWFKVFTADDILVPKLTRLDSINETQLLPITHLKKSADIFLIGSDSWQRLLEISALPRLS